jgi:hypothetical protein
VFQAYLIPPFGCKESGHGKPVWMAQLREVFDAEVCQGKLREGSGSRGNEMLSAAKHDTRRLLQAQVATMRPKIDLLLLFVALVADVAIVAVVAIVALVSVE